jgi:hypothetical protein
VQEEKPDECDARRLERVVLSRGRRDHAAPCDAQRDTEVQSDIPMTERFEVARQQKGVGGTYHPLKNGLQLRLDMLERDSTMTRVTRSTVGVMAIVYVGYREQDRASWLGELCCDSDLARITN